MTLWVFLAFMALFLAIGIASVRRSRGTVDDYYVASRSVAERRRRRPVRCRPVRVPVPAPAAAPWSVIVGMSSLLVSGVTHMTPLDADL